ncbi:hypothetical protein GCM10009541_40740 [Micromonospora gifhornensis]|uniref:Uncharacterized protein n=1 Tax=Micromonospora gifhornensis TaxID=84594 RepID=A0ABQ4IMY6_9ACTN|nr:hypothetical protein Vgi01_57520 [Micromonospora gifhornensis]
MTDCNCLLQSELGCEPQLNSRVSIAAVYPVAYPALHSKPYADSKGGELMLRSGDAVATAKLRSEPTSIYSRVAEPGGRYLGLAPRPSSITARNVFQSVR